MSWGPANDYERWTDWSWYQNLGPDHYHKPLDVNQFLDNNPWVEGVYLRACRPGGCPDDHFPYYFDAFTKRDVKVAIYLWPSDRVGIFEMLENWRIALDGRRSPMAALDIENHVYWWEGAQRTRHTEIVMDALLAADDLMGVPVDIYTRASYWDINIAHGLWATQRQFWLAHYPLYRSFGLLPSLKVRQAASHDEMARRLPIVREGIPRLGTNIKPDQVIGWQFSEKGKAVGLRQAIDLDYFCKDHIAERYAVGGVSHAEGTGTFSAPAAEHGGVIPPAPPSTLPTVNISYDPKQVNLEVKSVT